MPKRRSLLALIALAPLAWFVLEGAFLTLRYGSILSRYGAEGLTTGLMAISLMRDVAARHAAWGACIAMAVWRSVERADTVAPPRSDREPRWAGWIATWLWVPLAAVAGVLIATTISLGLSSVLFHAELAALAGNVAELSRPQDVAVLLLRSSVFATAVATGAHAWRKRLGPAPGARRWNVTLWRAGATCAVLTLLELLPWWRLVDDQPAGGGFPLDPTTLS